MSYELSGWFKLSHVSPMSFDLSWTIVALLTCVAHGLWTSHENISLLVCVAHELLTFCAILVHNHMSRPWAMNFLGILYFLVLVTWVANELITSSCGVSSSHMCRPCALNFLVRFLIQIACVAHRPWAFSWDFVFKSHAEPMRNELSCEILILSTSLICSPWAMNFHFRFLFFLHADV